MLLLVLIEVEIFEEECAGVLQDKAQAMIGH
jgi:hypothetical protein